MGVGEEDAFFPLVVDWSQQHHSGRAFPSGSASRRGKGRPRQTAGNIPGPMRRDNRPRMAALSPLKPDALHVSQYACCVFRVKQSIHNGGSDPLFQRDHYFLYLYLSLVPNRAGCKEKAGGKYPF